MNNFLQNTYKNISWITLIDSWKPWKNIGIIAITHWNEPVWLKIFEYLINEFKINEKLKWWKIYLIANNIEAHKNYLESKDINKFRFINNNMNRISNKDFKYWSYEFERLDELKQIFDEIDIAIDIHSVSKWNDLIWISDKKYLNEAMSFFDVETFLVDEIWNTWDVIWYLIRNWKIGFGIECGNHIDDRGFENWKRNILNFLSYYGSIKHTIKSSYDNIYEFVKEIYPKSDNFKYTKDFVWFTKLEKDEKFAVDWDLEHKNDLWENIYLWFPKKIPKKWDWAGFLFKKLK